ncbi:MAG: response regulator [Acidobacteriota bacterium]
MKGTAEKARILVVEDNPADVELLRLALGAAELDYELTVIDDGGDAMAYVQQKGKYVASTIPDLAVLDLNLPKSEGVEILEAMRSHPPFSQVPVAILSSSPWLRERTKMEGLHVQRYITKPPDLEEYLRIGLIVKELLSEIPVPASSSDKGEAGSTEVPCPAQAHPAPAPAAGIPDPDPAAEY